MRDGISLSADVYLPLGGVVAADDRAVDAVRVDARALHRAGASGSRSAATPPSSSTCAAATSRTGSSPRGSTTGSDAHDTRHVGGGEQWSNGRIGTWGRSYGGLVQWQLAHLGHPNLVCIAPQVIHDDYFWDGYWTGGAFQLALTLGAAALWTSAMALITGPSAADLVLNDRVFGHLPLIELDEVTIGRKVDYWRIWWEHQDERRVLAAVPAPAREGRRADLPAGRLVRPVLGLAPAHRSRRSATGVPNRVLMGPWSHEEEVETSAATSTCRPRVTVIRDHELVFYDRFLKDEPNDWDERPPLELFVLGANEWRGEQRVAARADRVQRRGTSQRRPGDARRRRRSPGAPGTASRPTGTPTTRRIRCRRSAASTRC